MTMIEKEAARLQARSRKLHADFDAWMEANFARLEAKYPTLSRFQIELNEWHDYKVQWEANERP